MDPLLAERLIGTVEGDITTPPLMLPCPPNVGNWRDTKQKEGAECEIKQTRICRLFVFVGVVGMTYT